MIGLYLLSIGIAWLVAPGSDKDAAAQRHDSHLKLVFAAAVVDQAWRQRTTSAAAARQVGPFAPRAGS